MLFEFFVFFGGWLSIFFFFSPSPLLSSPLSFLLFSSLFFFLMTVEPTQVRETNQEIILLKFWLVLGKKKLALRCLLNWRNILLILTIMRSLLFLSLCSFLILICVVHIFFSFRFFSDNFPLFVSFFFSFFLLTFSLGFGGALQSCCSSRQ